MNPMIVEGQGSRGWARGSARPVRVHTPRRHASTLTGSYMDNPMPRAEDVPFYNVDYSCQTPCTHNPLGVKGCGEAGPSVPSGGGQRGDRRAVSGRACHVTAYRHAGLAVAGLAGDQRVMGPSCTTSTSQKPATLPRRPRPFAEAAGAVGRADADPDDETALAQPALLVSLTGIACCRASAWARGPACGGGHAPCGCRPRGPRALPRTCRFGRGHRRPGGARAGTIGGSIANNDPAACYPSAVLASGATVVTNRRNDRRGRLLQGLFTTALEEARSSPRSSSRSRRRRPMRSSTTRQPLCPDRRLRREVRQRRAGRRDRAGND